MSEIEYGHRGVTLFLHVNKLFCAVWNYPIFLGIRANKVRK